MPTLPQYDAQRNIQAKKAAPFRQEVDQAFAPQEKVTKTMVDISQQWSDTNDAIEGTSSKAMYGKGKAAILQDSILNPGNIAEHQKQLSELKAQSLEGISNAQVRNQLSMEYDYENGLASIKMQNNFRQSKIKIGRSDLNDYITVEADSYSKASPIEKLDIENDVKNELEVNKQKFVINPVEQKEILQKFYIQAAQFDVAYDPSTSPEESLVHQELQKGDKGEYANLLPDERVALAKDISTKINSNKVALKTARENAIIKQRIDIISQLSEQPVDWATASNLANQVAGEDPKLAEGIMNSARSTAYDPEEANEAFLELSTNIFESKDNKKISDFLTAALQDENISRDRLNVLVFSAKARSQELETKEVNWSPALDILKKSAAALGIIPMVKIQKKTADLTQQLIKTSSEKKLTGIKIVEEANSLVRQESIKKYPFLEGKEEGDPFEYKGKSLVFKGWNDNNEPMIEVQINDKPKP